jgi:hypothetical protein
VACVGQLVNMAGKYVWVVISPEDKSLMDAKMMSAKPSLHELQQAVDGRIERIPSSWTKAGIKTIYVNEEGAWKNLPPNPLVQELLDVDMDYPIVGSVVVQWQPSRIMGE